MPGTILLADDEEKILKTLGRALRDEGHDVVTSASARETERLLAERTFDLLIIDYLMPDKSGLDVIRDLAASFAEAERPAIVMMTAHGSIESAVEAMKLGARDYLQKPFEVDELLVTARRAIEDQRARLGLRYLLSERDAEFGHYGIVGNSRAVRELLARAERVAASKSTVLLTGETGTGKELVARAIHARSAQHDMPLIKVNCAAIPETLLESELFGHTRGAFTGAATSKKGRFALADGGTIFLDEIATISQAVQAKLLRVLQDREFEPLGAERTQRVDVRVIAATNRDLRQMVAEGRFQEDLFYRLNVIPITLPPLRERREDIPLLVDHFVRRFSAAMGKPLPDVEPGVLDELTRYDWPGNVRELENTIERAVVLATGPRLTREAVWLMGATTPAASAGLPSLRLHQNVEWAERETIQRALDRAGGVKKDAAEMMGISQRALSHYLLKYKDSL
ncbi:MAG: sigma-54-dependent Fis family transcriptional regulator [Acidobacteria bacterium]|nr:sigma-54-dependent Fis family transcriptional regulator [Acidobacteriota bacterium]